MIAGKPGVATLLYQDSARPSAAVASSRKIDLGRGGRIHKCETTVDELAGQVGYARVQQVEKEGPALQGAGQSAQLGKEESLLGIHEIENPEKIIKGLLILPTGPGGPDDGWHHIALHELLKKRQRLGSEPVAGGKGIFVTGILPVENAALLQVGIDLAASDPEEGPKQREFFPVHHEIGLIFHAFQSGRTTQEVEEHCLGIVVRMMGQDHVWAPVFAGTFHEKLMAGPAGSHLEGDLFFFGATLDVCPGNLKG